MGDRVISCNTERRQQRVINEEKKTFAYPKFVQKSASISSSARILNKSTFNKALWRRENNLHNNRAVAYIYRIPSLEFTRRAALQSRVQSQLFATTRQTQEATGAAISEANRIGLYQQRIQNQSSTRTWITKKYSLQYWRIQTSTKLKEHTHALQYPQTYRH